MIFEATKSILASSLQMHPTKVPEFVALLGLASRGYADRSTSMGANNPHRQPGMICNDFTTATDPMLPS